MNEENVESVGLPRSPEEPCPRVREVEESNTKLDFVGRNDVVEVEVEGTSEVGLG